MVMFHHRSRALAVSLLILFLGLSVLAAESWRTKPYEKWTRKDIDKILNDSPWTKVITIPWYPYLNGDSPEYHQKIQIGKVPYDPANNPWPSAGKSTAQPEGVFLLRWNSALTVRRALYREEVRRGADPDGAARRHLHPDPASFELALIAVGGTFLPPVEPDRLVANTYLELMPSGHKIAATDVQIRAPVGPDRQLAYLFRFPRLDETGNPVISTGTSEVEFFSQVGVRIFVTKFRPDKMVGRDGADY